MRLRAYIVNMHTYVEGKPKGEWFDLPVSFEKVKETIGLDDTYTEYAIHDYDLPFYVDEFVNIEKLNKWAEAIENSQLSIENEKDLEKVIASYDNVEHFLEHLDDIVLYPGIESIRDLAEILVEEGEYGEIPDKIIDYIDYDAIARDLSINYNLVVCDSGIFDCPRR